MDQTNIQLIRASIESVDSVQRNVVTIQNAESSNFVFSLRYLFDGDNFSVGKTLSSSVPRIRLIVVWR